MTHVRMIVSERDADGYPEYIAEFSLEAPRQEALDMFQSTLEQLRKRTEDQSGPQPPEEMVFDPEHIEIGGHRGSRMRPA